MNAVDRFFGAAWRALRGKVLQEPLLVFDRDRRLIRDCHTDRWGHFDEAAFQRDWDAYVEEKYAHAEYRLRYVAGYDVPVRRQALERIDTRTINVEGWMAFVYEDKPWRPHKKRHEVKP